MGIVFCLEYHFCSSLSDKSPLGLQVRKWQPTPVFLPGESQGRGSLVGCRLWGRTESDMAEATWQQQQLLGRKVMTNLDSILKSRDITLPTKVRLFKAMDFPMSHVWM